MPNADFDSRYGPVLATGLSFDCVLEYENAAGELSRRTITVNRLHGAARGMPPTLDVDYVRGFCHERRALRCFRSDRILALADPETGEVVTNPEAWLCTQAGLTALDATPHFPRPSILRVSPTPAMCLWQRTPGKVEVFGVEIDEVQLRGGAPVGFRGRAERRPDGGASLWRGDKTFDLDLSDGDGVLSLEFDGFLMEDMDEIAAWLAGLRAPDTDHA